MTIAPIQNTISSPVIQTVEIRSELTSSKERNDDVVVQSPQRVKLISESNTKKLNTDFNKLSESLQDIFNTPDTALRFSIDNDTNKIILKIVNSATNEVVQQIPSELALQLSKFIASTLEQQGHVTDSTI
ncbi:MAG: flagellar protein FlaG [Ignavibacteria bacterium]|nr:flagellar protein FlaG [Ignavibacteria bacterium]